MPRSVQRVRSEAEAAQLLGVTLPVLGNGDVQVEVHPGTNQRFDLQSRPPPDISLSGVISPSVMVIMRALGQ